MAKQPGGARDTRRAGAKVGRRVYRMEFTDGDYEGLWVRIRGLALGKFLQLQELADAAQDEGRELETVRELWDLVAANILEWNLEDDQDQPIPPAESFDHVDIQFMLHLVLEWMNAMGDVDAPLGLPANNGGTSPAALIPMEPLSPSRVS